MKNSTILARQLNNIAKTNENTIICWRNAQWTLSLLDGLIFSFHYWERLGGWGEPLSRNSKNRFDSSCALLDLLENDKRPNAGRWLGGYYRNNCILRVGICLERICKLNGELNKTLVTHKKNSLRDAYEDIFDSQEKVVHKKIFEEIWEIYCGKKHQFEYLPEKIKKITEKEFFTYISSLLNAFDHILINH